MTEQDITNGESIANEIIDSGEDQGQEETKEQTYHYDTEKMGMVPDGNEADDSTEVESGESSGKPDSVTPSGDDGSGEKEVSAS